MMNRRVLGHLAQSLLFFLVPQRAVQGQAESHVILPADRGEGVVQVVLACHFGCAFIAPRFEANHDLLVCLA
jgi:hypothetical protein